MAAVIGIENLRKAVDYIGPILLFNQSAVLGKIAKRNEENWRAFPILGSLWTCWYKSAALSPKP